MDAPAPGRGGVVASPRRKSARLTLSQLRKLCRHVLDIDWKLRQASKEDLALEVIERALNGAWKALDELVSKRELDAAQAKDRRLPENERVCWTLVFPKDYGWEAQQFMTRTPHTMIRQYSSFGGKLDIRPADPGRVWEDLAYQLKQRPAFDLARFQAHAQRVDAEWAKYRQSELYTGRVGFAEEEAA